MPATLKQPRATITTVVTAWLIVCCLLVFCMVVLGGAVRLTGAGLSIVEWQLIMGVIPPLAHAEWLQTFAKYQQFPQFKLVNADITLSQFKFIFWMEYAHRLFGRVIGFIFLLPFLFFLYKRILPRAMLGRLWLLFLLGGLQGALGWYLVKSGLLDNPRVSPYRLVMHFMLAVLIYAYLVRVAVGYWLGNLGKRIALSNQSTPPSPTPSIKIMHTSHIGSAKVASHITLTLLFLMLASGALVAGTQAGLAYNTWPKMNEFWIPQPILAMQPWWQNFFANIATIQFVHRWLSVLVLFAVGSFAYTFIRTASHIAQTYLGYLLLIAVSLQILLGITTLLLRVPVALGIAHQAGAMVLLTVVVVAVATRLPQFDSIQHAPG